MENGYGTISVKNKLKSVHRIMAAHAFGGIPEGLLVCHHCDVKPCCNPSHLFLGTHKDNAQDLVKKGLFPNRKGPNGPAWGKFGAKSPHHVLTQEIADNIRYLRFLEGWTWQRIADKYGIGLQTVGLVVHNKTWIRS